MAWQYDTNGKPIWRGKGEAEREGGKTISGNTLKPDGVQHPQGITASPPQTPTSEPTDEPYIPKWIENKLNQEWIRKDDTERTAHLARHVARHFYNLGRKAQQPCNCCGLKIEGARYCFKCMKDPAHQERQPCQSEEYDKLIASAISRKKARDKYNHSKKGKEVAKRHYEKTHQNPRPTAEKKGEEK